MATTKVQSELIVDDVALAGNPTTTTQSAGNATTRIATTAFIDTAISNLIDSAPGTLNTLNEIAAALNDDPSFTTTVNNAIATKLPLAGGTMTGNVTFSSGGLGIGVAPDSTHLLTLQIETLGDDFILAKQADGGQAFRVAEDGGGDTFLELGTTSLSNSVLLQADGISHFLGGIVAIGHTASITQEVVQSGSTISSWTPDLQVNKSANGGVAISQWNTGNTASANLWLTKSSNATVGTHGGLSENEAIGRIIFSSSDGSTFTNSASIEAFAGSGHGSNDTPGRLEFKTTADGAAVPTTRMTVDYNGNVGIGTASPNLLLHLASGQPEMNFTIPTASTSALLGGIHFGNDNVDPYLASIYSYQDGATDAADLRFHTEATGAGKTEKMRIQSGGQVGIGSTNPAAWGMFVVSGTGNLATLTASSGAGALAFAEGGTGRFYLKTLNGSDGLSFVDADNSTERMRIDDGGKVGIGETTPLAKLHVKEGDSGFGSTINTNFDQLCLEDDSHSGMTILSGANSDGAIYFGDDASATQGQLKYKHSDNSFRFVTSDGNDSLVLDSGLNATFGGNVGIGVSPAQLLHIKSAAPDIRIEDSDGGYVDLNAPGGSLELRADQGNAVGSSEISFWVDGGEKAVIDASGNVGIGTTSNTIGGMLETYNATDNTKHWRIHRPGSAEFGIGVTGTTLAISANSGMPPTSDQGIFMLFNSGNVGIGTASPGQMLVAKGAAGTSPILEMINSDTEDNESGRETSLRFSGFRSGGEATVNAQISGHHTSSSDNDNGMLMLWTNSGSGIAERMRITTGGLLSVKSDGGSNSLRFVDSGGTVDGYVYADSGQIGFLDDDGQWMVNCQTDSVIKFVINNDEKVRVLDSGGIAFNGDSAAANGLDDYEEGNWTPSVTMDTGTVTLKNVVATYTKIGRTVTINAHIQIASISSPTGAVSINNLPFTVGTQTGVAVWGHGLDSDATTALQARVVNTESRVRLQKYVNGADTPMADDLVVDSAIVVGCTYNV